MELIHSRGHFLKGESVHRHRQGGSGTANPPSKLDWKLGSSKQHHQQHRHSHQNAAQHFLGQSQVKVEHGERGVLPQSSSMEPQTTAGPKVCKLRSEEVVGRRPTVAGICAHYMFRLRTHMCLVADSNNEAVSTVAVICSTGGIQHYCCTDVCGFDCACDLHAMK